MTNNRKEPTFSSVSQDDSTTTVMPQTRAEPGAAASVRGATRAPAPRTVVKNSPLVPFALLLALTGLGLAGFTYWQLLQAQQLLSTADKRIVNLESQLSLSDDESTQSVTALQSNLRETRDSLELAHSEIRKLWDTRNVNRKGIADNSKLAESAAAAAKSASTSAASALKTAQQQADNWKALSREVTGLAEQLRIASDLTADQQKRVREVVDTANRLESQFKLLKSDLARRVQSNEEAIQSFDNYRRIVNRDILQLKEQLSGPN